MVQNLCVTLYLTDKMLINIVAYIDSLLGNDRETNNEILIKIYGAVTE
jgi:hypothetical protein